jgi:hypothetical protein
MVCYYDHMGNFNDDCLPFCYPVKCGGTKEKRLGVNLREVVGAM